MMTKTQNYHEKHKSRYLEELFEFLRIPSVSANPEHKEDMYTAARWLEEKLVQAGADRTELVETEGHPILYAEKILDSAWPTVLVYGHYDVQPPDPLELWTSAPFDPVVKDDRIYARGSCDDKGQLYMHVKAFEAMVATGELPCNVKFMLEGEEEVGSVHLEDFIRSRTADLSCDVILISDTSIIANDVPSITVGLRGLSYMEVEVTGPNRDLHSGTFGGAVANPCNILCQMIAKLHDKNNRITIPGFYDRVKQLSSQERIELNKAPFDLEAYKKDLAIGDVLGEEGYTTLERASIRPTLDVNGIWGGYTGEGAKTVLPSKAYAKISMRLVPNQDHERISRIFASYFESLAPAGVQVKVIPHHGGAPAETPTDTIAYQSAARAMKKTFGVEPIPARAGGSIPIVALFEEVLKVKTVLMGFGLNKDNIHSPNESYGLFNFYKGIETIPYYYQYFRELKA